MNPTFNLIDHLKNRHLNLSLHPTILDSTENVATFILYTLTGKLAGYQRYRPLGEKKQFNHPKFGKYHTYRKQKTISFWGMESYFISDGPIFICEGVFDAARLTNRGYTALATLANNPPKDYRNWLDCIPRKKIVICDNDSAGKKLRRLSDHFEIIENCKDLGEAPEDYVSYLLGKWTSGT
jgi:hypothetical protein